MIEIVSESDHVICPICGKQMKYINNSHLRSHGYNSEKEFKDDYPDAELRASSVSDNTLNHLRKLNSDPDLQSAKAKNGWTDDRRKQKSDQMKDVCYHLHNDDKYADSRAKIYKNRHGIKKKFIRSDGRVINCRSFLEWKICLFLDSNNFNYEYETLEIRYFNDYDKKYKMYIPDFYLPDYNLIIEGKYSNETEYESVISKMNAAIDKGYKYMFVDEDLIKNEKELLNQIALHIK